MQIVRDLAGYSLGRSDLVRRAMSKKKHDVMAKERQNFIYGIEENGVVTVDGALRRGVSKEAAESIFDEMMDFASYAFNKAHAACYAVVAYRTAFLKCLHPVEFMTALINSFITVQDTVASYIGYCKQRGIRLLPPDVNASLARFSVENGAIRFGLAAIKNVGEGVINEVLEQRQTGGAFRDFSDFVKRAGTINKRTLEWLIKAGCFDSFGVSRKYLMAHYELELASAGAERKRIELGQFSLFDIQDSAAPKLELGAEAKSEFILSELLAMEHEATGVYISGHPLMEYEKELSELKQSCKMLNDAEENGPITDGSAVRVGGIIASVKTRPIKNGSGVMATGVLEDMNGTVEFLAFPTVYQKCAQLLLKDKRVILTGRLSMREDKPNTVMVDDAVPLIKLDTRRLALNFTAETEPLKKRIIEALRRFPGNMEVVFANSVTRKQELAPRELSVHNSADLMMELKALLGAENVKLIARK